MTQSLIGFLLSEYSIIGFIIFVFGWELELKEKIKMLIGFMIFLTALTVGVGMACGFD